MSRISSPALALTLLTLLSCGGGARSAAPPAGPDVPDDTGATAGTGAAPTDVAAPDPGAKTRTLTADTEIKTASGTTFTAPSAWIVEERSDRVLLTAPEKDVVVALYELKAADRDAAVNAAWQQWKPGFKLAVALAQDAPARDGWDAVSQIVYVTPTAEQRLVLAVARRKGDVWYVALLDGSAAGVDRRGAQLGLVVESFKVPGIESESFAGKTPHAFDKARQDQLTAFAETALARNKVPGAAIAVVQGGKVVYARGFGVRAKGKKAAVTPRTLFMIGSVNKSLTTLMLARLVEKKTFSWDTPVTQVLPSFALGDATTTSAVTMRHTACACTGMPRQDLEFIFEGHIGPEERLASMATMKPTTGFGETFQYSNLMVSAGGFAGAHAFAPRKKLGAAYDDAMAALVFKPLGMKASTFDFKKVARAEHAAPHPFGLDGEPAAMPITLETWVQPLRPAGGMWSNVEDMARFALLELGAGKLDGKQVVDTDALMARRAPQVKINDELSYGLGFAVGKAAGVQVVTHSGGTMGFNSEFLLLPEHGIGLVILTNVGSGALFTGTVERRLLELLFDGEARAASDLERRADETFKQLAEENKLIELKPDPAWFATFIGTWTTPGLGTIELRVDKGQPVLDSGDWKVNVGRKNDRDGTVKLIATTGPFAGLELVPTEKDGKTTLVLIDSQRSYVFEKKAD
jgi:CubicO group peptidase (beta-lactamase class C family)